MIWKAAEMLTTKCVWSPIDKKRDGVRILVTRFRGRRLPKTRYDVWMPKLGPSEKLLRAFSNEKIKWPEFVRRYREEMFTDGSVDKKNATIKNHGQKFTLRLIKRLARSGNVTLMCHCREEQEHCHRHVLRRIIEGKQI